MSKSNTPLATEHTPEAIKNPKVHKKQHRWTDEKTVIFFKIVDIHRPFDCNYGMLTEAWEKTANEYNKAINEPDALSGKVAWVYHKASLKKHCQATNISKKAS